MPWLVRPRELARLEKARCAKTLNAGSPKSPKAAVRLRECGNSYRRSAQTGLGISTGGPPPGGSHAIRPSMRSMCPR